MSYADKLKDPRWQKKRLEMMENKGWRCECCGSTEDTLAVHHGYYKRGNDPWDYDEKTLNVLCEKCHVAIQESMTELHYALAHVPVYLIDGWKAGIVPFADFMAAFQHEAGLVAYHFNMQNQSASEGLS